MISARKRPLACLALGAGLVAGRFPASSLAAAGPPATPNPAPRAGRRTARRPGTVDVRLVALNDFHGAISADRMLDGRPLGGAAHLAAHVARLRAERPGRALVLHAGDAVSASPAVSAMFQDEPAIAVLNAIGVDAGVVGNHEFDEGPAELRRLLTGGAHPATAPRFGPFPGARFPTLAANVVDAATGAPVLPPTRVAVVGGLPIGLIGVVTTETPRSVGPGVAGLSVLDEAATVRHHAARLRADGVRAIVVLAHLGGRVDPNTGRVAGPIADLARATAGLVDVVVSAHTHVGYVEEIGGVLVTQAWAYGEALAAIDLALDAADGRVVAKSARLVRTWHDEEAPDPVIAALVAGYEKVAAPVLAAPVAYAAAPVTRERSDGGEQALGNLIADAYRRATGAGVALAHPGWNWADLPAGRITWGDLFQVQPAGHDLVALRLSGDQLRRLLEEQWRPERVSPLQVSGLAVEADPDCAFGRRIGTVRVGGAPLDPSHRYAVALNAYLAGGGDLFAVPLECAARTPGPKDLAALIDHVRRLPQPFAAKIEGRLRRSPTAVAVGTG